MAVKSCRLLGMFGLVAIWTIWTPPTAVGSEVPANSIRCKNGAVAAEHRLASRAGVEILEAGGNAIDAAVAASLATGVVNPSSSGLGGGGFMTIFLAADARAHVVDYRETAPGQAHRDMYLRDGKAQPTLSRTGGLAVGIPGEVAGLALALERFGTMSLAEVAQPAIRIARDGFVIEKHLARMLEIKRDALAQNQALAAVFLAKDSTPYPAGHHLDRPGIATTLERLAKHGYRDFYEGDLAREIVAAVDNAGGILEASDLASYQPQERSALIVDYRGRKLITMPPPSSGGGTIATVLQVLEGYDLAGLGHNSETYLHLLAESLKAAFADRAIHYGDPAFTKVPIQRLTSPAHALEIRRGLSAVRAVPSANYGKVAPPTDAGTSHISVIDAQGNAVAATTSVNTAFGSTVGVPGRGIVLNNTMDDFSAQPGVPNSFGLVGSEANAVAAGKRPLSSMSPTIVLEDGRAKLVAGASGGPMIITATLQTVLNILEFGMSAQEGVAAPRIHHQWLPEVLGVEEAIPTSKREALERRGHKLRTLPGSASVQVVEVVTENGQRILRAASDPRKGGVPAGY